jgi:hypothetical protein
MQSNNTGVDQMTKSYNRRNLMRWIALLTPVFQIALLCWVYYLYRVQAPYPTHWPFTILVLAIVIGSVTQCVFWLRALWTKQDRLRELRWLTVVLLPGLAAIWGGLYAHRISSNRYIPDNLLMRWMGSAGVSLADLERSIRYPIVYEGQRVDMYCAREIADGPELVRQMDEHISALEKRIGRTSDIKARWIRGDILGRNNYQFFGLAMSDYEPSAENQEPTIHSLDRHELAHFVLSQFMNADSSPPCLMLEGWAQMMSLPSEKLAIDAWRHRYLEHGTWSLQDLTTMPWYRYSRQSVYSIGGAFVDYLIRHHGIDSFVTLYLMANEEHFADQFQDIYHISLSEIEPEFWKEIDAQTPDAERKQISKRIDPAAYNQEDGKALWIEIASALNSKSKKDLYNYEHTHIHSEMANETATGTLQSRVAQDLWVRGEEIWCRSRVLASENGMTAEYVMFASMDDAFALERSSKNEHWQPNLQYSIDGRETEVRQIRSAATNNLPTGYLETIGAEMLGESTLLNYRVSSVRDVSRDNGSPLIEIKLEPRTDSRWIWRNVSMQFDRDLDYRLVSWTNQYADHKRESRVNQSAYFWTKESGNVRLTESVGTVKLLDGSVESSMRTQYSYEVCPDQDFPPFRKSDFPVQSKLADSFPLWAQLSSEPTLDSGFMMLTMIDLLVLCISSGIIHLRRRTVPIEAC